MSNPDRVEDARRRHRRRYLDRITAFSDGVVAIALTLLVLPLVDIVPPDLSTGQTTWQALSANSALLWSFAVTFLVIAVLWMAHSRLFMFIDQYDAFIVWLNVLYLFAIVVLPFPSKWLQVEGFDGGVGSFYFAALALASCALAAIAWHSGRHPELLTDGARDDPDFMARRGRGWFYAGYFVVGSALAAVRPGWASWYLIALFPASLLWRRFVEIRSPQQPPPQNP